MPGLIGAGAGYQQRALSGFARASALEQQREEANTRLEAQRKSHKSQTSGGLTGVGAAAGGIAGAALTAAPTAATATAAASTGGALAGLGLGAWGGPIGMVIGAGLGFLFSQLF